MTVPDQPETYVRRRELARIMGVSVATIDRMVRAGMPSELWGQRARRFLPSEAIAWAKAGGAATAPFASLDARRRDRVR